MKAQEFGMKFKIENVGHMDMRSEADLNTVISIAEKAFREDVVRSICIYDIFGIRWLYLKKTIDGKIVRKERRIPYTPSQEHLKQIKGYARALSDANEAKALMSNNWREKKLLQESNDILEEIRVFTTKTIRG